MEIRSSWTPRLKSVKFEFDTQQHTVPATSDENVTLKASSSKTPFPSISPESREDLSLSLLNQNDGLSGQHQRTETIRYAAPKVTPADMLDSDGQKKCIG